MTSGIFAATPARIGVVTGLDTQNRLLVTFPDYPGPPHPVVQFPAPVNAPRVGDTVVVLYGVAGYPVAAVRLAGAGGVATGAATITAGTSVVVPHGLSGAPTQVQLTPQGNPGGAWWYDTVTATSFTLRTAVSGTVTFAWRAAIGNG